jgi:hypothetical protein
VVNGKEFTIHRDNIHLEDYLLGIIDEDVEHEILRVQ